MTAPTRDLAAGSWSTFGERVLARTGVAPCTVFAFRASDGALRLLAEASDLGWRDGVDVADHRSHFAAPAVAALVDNTRRILRWGGASTCTLYAHSLRVAVMAGELSALTGGDELEQRAARALGAAHDLHEALPGIGDIPGPALRWLRSVSPEVDGLHRRGEMLVLDLTDLRGCITRRTQALWRWADRAALAVERALYFNDCPEWLGAFAPLGRLDEALTAHGHEIDGAADDGLLPCIAGHAVAATNHDFAQRVLQLAPPELLALIPSESAKP